MQSPMSADPIAALDYLLRWIALWSSVENQNPVKMGILHGPDT